MAHERRVRSRANSSTDYVALWLNETRIALVNWAAGSAFELRAAKRGSKNHRCVAEGFCPSGCEGGAAADAVQGHKPFLDSLLTPVSLYTTQVSATRPLPQDFHIASRMPMFKRFKKPKEDREPGAARFIWNLMSGPRPQRKGTVGKTGSTNPGAAASEQAGAASNVEASARLPKKPSNPFLSPEEKAQIAAVQADKGSQSGYKSSGSTSRVDNPGTDKHGSPSGSRRIKSNGSPSDPQPSRRA